jgi:hypothetical protein
MSVGDARRAPFCWQSVRALGTLRAAWDPDACRPALGLAVYVALTEIANEDRARSIAGADSDGFVATRRRIASKACVSDRSIDAAAEELERLGLLAIRRRRNGAEHLPSTYVLLEPGSGENGAGGGEQISQGVANGVPKGGEERSHITQEVKKRSEVEAQRASTSSLVREVFDAWVEATGRTSRTKLDGNRRRLIERALHDYSLEDVLAAVRGWRHSPHHRGENSNGTSYTGLSLLLRDAEHIETFRDLECKHGGKADDEMGAFVK